MQKEVESVMRSSGMKLNFKLKSELSAGETFSEVVMMSFRGKCGMDNFPIVFDERGPLAFARTVNGEVQPYGVVRCDHVRKSVRSAMWGKDYSEADTLLGRALGRVVAHELYHMLGKTQDHAHEGIARKALSGKALVSDKLEFTADTLVKLHTLRRRGE